MVEQVRLCAVWPTEIWLGSSLNQILGWTTVLESYSHVLEQGPLDRERALARLSGTDRPSLSIHKSKRSEGDSHGTSSLALHVRHIFQGFPRSTMQLVIHISNMILPPPPSLAPTLNLIAREKDCLRAISLESCHKNVIH